MSSSSSDDNTSNLACPYCLKAATSTSMVKCTLCKNWIHYQCANVSNSVQFDEEWRCKYCNVNTPAPKKDLNPTNLFERIRQGAPGVVTRAQSKQAAAPQVPINQPKAGPSNQPPPKPVPINESTKEVSKKTAPVPAPRSVHSQAASNKSKHDELLAELEETEAELNLVKKEKMLMERRKKLREELERCEYQSVVSDDESEVAEQPHVAQQQSRVVGQLPSVPQPTFVQQPHTTFMPQQQFMEQSSFAQQPFEPRTLFDQSERRTTNNLSQLTMLPNYLTPTPAQLAARHSMGQSLEKFNGKPSQWLTFATQLRESTIACGFSHNENLVRLNKCLEGEARRMVETLLMKAENLPIILSTLKDLYGRPDLLIDDMLTKIRSYALPKSGGFDHMLSFAVEVRNLSVILEDIELEDYRRDPSMLKEIICKLPEHLKYKWSTYSASHPDQSHDIVFCANWLYRIALNLRLTIPSTSTQSEAPQSKPSRKKESLYYHDTQKKEKCCFCCNGECEHVSKCSKFIEMKLSNRWECVKQNKLCSRCLYQHYYRAKCAKRPPPCDVSNCTKYHHPLMHNYDKDNQETPNVNVNEATNYTHSCEDDYKYRYLPVVIHYRNKSVATYAFLDEGSSTTLMTQRLANCLGAKGPVEPLCLTWTDESACREEAQSQTLSLEINAMYKNKTRSLVVHTVSYLKLPSQTLNYEVLAEKYEYLQDLEVNSYKNIVPELLIGLDNWNLALPRKYREGQPGDPIAVKCNLGWTVFATCNDVSRKSSFFHICVPPVKHTDDDLYELVQSHYRIDHLGVTKKMSALDTFEEQIARKIMEETAKKKDNRYEIGLLWNKHDMKIPNSSAMALHRLKCLENSLKKKSGLLEEMNKQITEYEAKGYIRKLSESEARVDHPKAWFLPIFVSLNPNKPGKIRMVWDAAAQVDGVSLNSMLLSGPDLNTPLLQVLFRFRQYPVAVGGDITEMFHRVMVRKEDQYSQMFYWRNGDQSKQPSVYVMQVLTFGSTCSPSCAQFIKNKNAQEYAHTHPEAAKAIIEHHYVDDWLQSFETVEEASKVAKMVREVHAKGGFHICKWISNNENVLQSLEEENSDNKQVNMQAKKDLNIGKVLGMWWETTNDMFTFSLKFNKGNKNVLSGQAVPTKRELLRILMSIYDPLGLLAQFLIYLKILLRKVWISRIDWDIQINEDNYYQFEKWLRVLPNIENLMLPRCFLGDINLSEDTIIQIHAFCDASQDAEATCVYLRFQDGQNIKCVLVAAKTRVAPLKITSIPKLELESAVLGTRLSNSVKNYLEYKINKQFMWSDSTTTLTWIRNSSRKRQEKFVAFRVSEILDTTNVENWHYVSTKNNVADDATKWSSPPELNSETRWYIGPDFLYSSDEDFWFMDENNLPSNTFEEPVQVVCTHQVKIPLIAIERFSLWKKLRKTVALFYYFQFCCQSRSRGHIMTMEMFQKADKWLYKLAQEEVYGDEIRLLKADKTKRVPKDSSIYKLSPYLDDDDVLRVKGRIDALAWLPLSTRRPIILPRTHHITNLIVSHYHEKFHHEHHNIVINELRQQYCIPKIRTVLRKVRNDCSECKIRYARPQEPEMAPLPVGRLSPYEAPFTHTGIDFCGPFNVTVKRSTEKRWIVLFTCLTTRAVHTEIAHGLDTDNCVMCIRTFMLMRGQPKVFYSDCGTNFIASEKILCQQIKQKDIAKKFEGEPMEWKFNPPASPAMGGAWERLVRALKRALYACTPTRNFTDPLLKACLAEATYIVNSRPLTYVPIDNENDDVLTPNHFLIGSSNGVKPTCELEDDNCLLKFKYLTAQQFRNHFWKRWISEYLPDLVGRTKNFEPKTPLEVGDVVIICDNTLPANVWPKGIVMEVFPGKDGQVRSALVKTTTRPYHRPTSKLAKVDIRSR